jgi:hypothetical protein
VNGNVHEVAVRVDDAAPDLDPAGEQVLTLVR